MSYYGTQVWGDIDLNSRTQGLKTEVVECKRKEYTEQSDEMHFAFCAPKSQKEREMEIYSTKDECLYPVQFGCAPSSHRPGNLFPLFSLFVTSHSLSVSIFVIIIIIIALFNIAYSFHLNLIHCYFCRFVWFFGRFYTRLWFSISTIF